MIRIVENSILNKLVRLECRAGYYIQYTAGQELEEWLSSGV